MQAQVAQDPCPGVHDGMNDDLSSEESSSAEEESSISSEESSSAEEESSSVEEKEEVINSAEEESINEEETALRKAVLKREPRPMRARTQHLHSPAGANHGDGSNLGDINGMLHHSNLALLEAQKYVKDNSSRVLGGLVHMPHVGPMWYRVRLSRINPHKKRGYDDKYFGVDQNGKVQTAPSETKAHELHHGGSGIAEEAASRRKRKLESTSREDVEDSDCFSAISSDVGTDCTADYDGMDSMASTPRTFGTADPEPADPDHDAPPGGDGMAPRQEAPQQMLPNEPGEDDAASPDHDSADSISSGIRSAAQILTGLHYMGYGGDPDDSGDDDYAGSGDVAEDGEDGIAGEVGIDGEDGIAREDGMGGGEEDMRGGQEPAPEEGEGARKHGRRDAPIDREARLYMSKQLPKPFTGNPRIYQSLHPTPTQTSLLTNIQNQAIKYNNEEVALKNLLHFPMVAMDDKAPDDLLGVVARPGPTIFHAMEQSNKSITLASECVVCAVMEVPHVVIVPEKVDSVQSNTDGKIMPVLDQINRTNGNRWQPMLAQVVTRQAGNWSAADNEQETVDKVKSGRLTIVVPGEPLALQRLVEYVERHDITGIHLTLDEADAMIASFVSREQADSGEIVPLRNMKEACLFRLLGRVPFGPGSRCRTAMWVSATHIATLWWHTILKVPFQALISDPQKLIEKNFATEKHIMLVRTLEEKDVNAASNYGMNTDPIREEMRQFRKDPRKGRLMFLATTPRVHAVGNTGVNLFQQAKLVLARYVPDAVCIVVCGDKHATLLYNSDDPTTSDPKCGMKLRPEKGKSKSACAIQWVDDNPAFTLKKPIVLLAYHCAGRAVSIRSDKRVITHIIARYQLGKSAADTRQMLMRGVGYTQKVREDNGFRHVRMVCTKMDFKLVRYLNEFTAKILKDAATGDGAGLSNWMGQKYHRKFRPLLEQKRKHMARGLNEPTPLVHIKRHHAEEDGNSRSAPTTNFTSKNGVQVFRLTWTVTDGASDEPGPSDRPAKPSISYQYEPLATTVAELPVWRDQAGRIMVGDNKAQLLTSGEFMDPSAALFRDADVSSFLEGLCGQPEPAVLCTMRTACQKATKRVLDINSLGFMQGAQKRTAAGNLNCPLYHTQAQYRGNTMFFYLPQLEDGAAADSEAAAAQQATQGPERPAAQAPAMASAFRIKQLLELKMLQELEKDPQVPAHRWYAWHWLDKHGVVRVSVMLHLPARANGAKDRGMAGGAARESGEIPQILPSGSAVEDNRGEK